MNCASYNTQPIINNFVGQTSGSIVASNGIFGDPCPGVYKILKVSLYIELVNVPTPEPTIIITDPPVEPTPTPTRNPRPRPTSTYTSTPQPTLEPTPTPTPEPTIEPTPEPTPTPTPTVTPTIEPTATPTSIPTPKPTIITPEPTPISTQNEENTPQPTITPSNSSSPTAAPEAPFKPISEPILPYTEADKITEQQASQFLETLSNPGEVIEESLQQTAQFINNLFTDPGATVSAVFKNVSQAGLDMTDDQREKAQEVIIPVVLVSNIVSTLIGRIK